MKLNLLILLAFHIGFTGAFAQPVITQKPSDQSAIAGSNANFMVVATGTEPLSYQWRSHANSITFTDILDETNASLTLYNVQSTSQRFCVVVSDGTSRSVTSTLARLTVTLPPPTLVSASSVNGGEIGLRFSREMSPAGLSLAARYQVVGSAGPVSVASVLPWPGNTSVVLRLSTPVSDTFRVSAQSIRDLAGTLVSPTSVTGLVWGASLTYGTVGNPAVAPELLSYAEGCVSIRTAGQFIADETHGYGFLRVKRTNDFDVRVRMDSVAKVTTPFGTGLANPLVAGGGLEIRNPSAPDGPSLALVAMATNGSRMFMFTITQPATNTAVNRIYAWGASSESFPIWLRLRRTGSEFRSYFATNTTDWMEVGVAQSLPSAAAVMEVGLVVTSYEDGVYATAEFGDFGDNPAGPNAVVEITSGPVDVITEENHAATFTAQAHVSGASEEDLVYQWQAENAPGSGQFTNIFFANSIRYITPLLSQADTGLRVRLLVRVNGGLPVISAPVRVTVTPDQISPTVLSAITHRGRPEIVVTFSEPITPDTALDLFNYSGNDFAVSPVAQNGAGNKVTLSLSEPLDMSSSHELTVAETGIQDLAGNSLLPTPSQVMVTEDAMQRGAALQELFFGASSVASLRFGSGFTSGPDSHTLVSQLEGPLDFADNYGTRLSGWLIPPVSGSYNFWMSSDDEGEFWLSTDDDPAKLVMLCREPSWNGSRQFNTLERRDPTAPENRSSTLFPGGVPLIAGQRYYFEALSVEGGGSDNLSVAWQVPGGTPPQDGGAPIGGAYLAFLGDPVFSTIQFNRQPSNTTAQSVVAVEGAQRFLLSQDFGSSNGGFTAAQSGNIMGAWTYDGASGFWYANGSDDLPPSEKLLSSPSIQVTQPGEVRLQFRHRFNFEENAYDGGHVRLSVNGSPFNPVPPAAFTSNSYGGAFGNEMLQNVTPGFNGTSPGYANDEFLTSEATLGVFKPGDRLAIQFRGLWDYHGVNPGPNWVIGSLEVTEGYPGRTEATFAVQAEATRSDNEPVLLSYAWQRDCGSGFTEIPGANEAVYRFVPALTDQGCRFRCQVFTPGASATSEAAMLTLVLPAITILRDNTELILHWTGGVLQEAGTVSGPWTDVSQATSPLRRSASTASRFYRLRSP